MRPRQSLSEEELAKQSRLNLLHFLHLTNDLAIKEMVESPQTRLHVFVDFFPALVEQAKNTTVKLCIPDTICLKDNKTLYVYSEEGNDMVRFREGAVALNSFIQRLEERSLAHPAITESYPQAILLDETGGHKLCLTLEEIRKRWLEARSITKMAQSFVIPKAKEIVKYRVIWVKDKQPLVFIITRTGSQTSVPDTLEEKRYLHDINVFSYAGRLFRSSFSPFFPYASNLRENLLEKQRHSSELKTGGVKKQLVVRTGQMGDVSFVRSTKYISQMDNMASVISGVLRNKLVQAGEDLKLLVFDVSQGLDNAYRLMNVKGMLASNKEPVMRLYSTVDMSLFQTITERRRPVVSKSMKIRAYFDRESTSTRSKRCPFVDMKEANERKMRIYSSNIVFKTPEIVSTPLPKSRLRRYCSQLIAETAQKYDHMRHHSNAVRKDSAVQELHFTRDSLLLKTILDKFVVKLSSTTLIDYFEGKGELFRLKTGLSAAICGKEGYMFRAKIRRCHLELGISGEDFELFLETFAETMKEEGVPEEDSERIIERLSNFRGDVICQ